MQFWPEIAPVPFFLLALLIVAVPGLGLSDEAAPKTRLIQATATTGGTYYPVQQGRIRRVEDSLKVFVLPRNRVCGI